MALTRAYRLVILDLVMPGVDGLTLLKLLLHHRPHPGSPDPLLLDGHEDQGASADQGAADDPPKPFALDELLARVRAA